MPLTYLDRRSGRWLPLAGLFEGRLGPGLAPLPTSPPQFIKGRPGSVEKISPPDRGPMLPAQHPRLAEDIKQYGDRLMMNEWLQQQQRIAQNFPLGINPGLGSHPSLAQYQAHIDAKLHRRRTAQYGFINPPNTHAGPIPETLGFYSRGMGKNGIPAIPPGIPPEMFPNLMQSALFKPPLNSPVSHGMDKNTPSPYSMENDNLSV